MNMRQLRRVLDSVEKLTDTAKNKSIEKSILSAAYATLQALEKLKEGEDEEAMSFIADAIRLSDEAGLNMINACVKTEYGPASIEVAATFLN